MKMVVLNVELKTDKSECYKCGFECRKCGSKCPKCNPEYPTMALNTELRKEGGFECQSGNNDFECQTINDVFER